MADTISSCRHRYVWPVPDKYALQRGVNKMLIMPRISSFLKLSVNFITKQIGTVVDKINQKGES